MLYTLSNSIVFECRVWFTVLYRDEETNECNTPTNTNQTVQTRYHMEKKQFPRNSETVQHVHSNKKNIDATKQNE